MTLISEVRPDASRDRPPPRTVPAGAGRRDAVLRWVLYLVLVAGALVTVSPLLWNLLSSFKPSGDILRSGSWWPATFTWENFSQLLSNPKFPRYFVNSVVVSATIVAGNIVLSSAVGYALSKLRFPGRRLVFAAVLVTFMVPTLVLFVPLFVTVAALNMTNTYAGLILPFLITPLGVFVMRQFISQLPDELLEAARIDGAGEGRIFFRVVFPLCGPAIATVGILSFVSSWNNLLWPLVIAQTEDMYTLPVGLTTLSQTEGVVDYGPLLAGSLVTILPIVVIFVFFQRYFIAGIASTGIK
ncbi:sugar ABC transporter permease [Amycolatopsis mediterranei S699]|uniref:Permease component of ABC-type sugar transport system n=2 Tax=Amycolatopsis mediterranei TaxID=33910 RepID=A0A0H3DDG1_AMYMU|nr:carbohydrate ABC transporter permease [Amycolatopsis mediterranei]ADJ48975.1 permease component of ABC-type sugar transport system [Amycolatopsis mediterranei U32]AEK45925.1 sugar ABC transporter permease [Amycolatopsis mediterranei S699]AFO80683.1 sugar ABC transporter permease [Amycolatopsis mediterranei S699]AGT87811.1 sugar ABC transporter permease [Amycolatopsis mediterranei RB]KDU93907.1 sugar ABC transporter permease [Amycolatopsis mediterranei]